MSVWLLTVLLVVSGVCFFQPAVDAEVVGNATQGIGCSTTATTTYYYYGQGRRPICCPNPTVAVLSGRTPPPQRDYIVDCVMDGDCWRGAMCGGCNQDYVGSRNGVALRCSNCEQLGLRIGPGKHCSCNRP